MILDSGLLFWGHPVSFYKVFGVCKVYCISAIMLPWKKCYCKEIYELLIYEYTVQDGPKMVHFLCASFFGHTVYASIFKEWSKNWLTYAVNKLTTDGHFMDDPETNLNIGMPSVKEISENFCGRHIYITVHIKLRRKCYSVFIINGRNALQFSTFLVKHSLNADCDDI